MKVKKKKMKKKIFNFFIFPVIWLRDISGNSPILPHNKYVRQYPQKLLFLEIIEAFSTQLTSKLIKMYENIVNHIPNGSFVSKYNHFGGLPLACLWWEKIGESTDMSLNYVIQKIKKLSFFSCSLSFFPKKCSHKI